MAGFKLARKKARHYENHPIFIFLGGYNCRHSLIPVSEKIVPKEDLSRIKNTNPDSTS